MNKKFFLITKNTKDKISQPRRWPNLNWAVKENSQNWLKNSQEESKKAAAQKALKNKIIVTNFLTSYLLFNWSSHQDCQKA